MVFVAQPCAQSRNQAWLVFSRGMKSALSYQIPADDETLLYCTWSLLSSIHTIVIHKKQKRWEREAFLDSSLYILFSFSHFFESNSGQPQILSWSRLAYKMSFASKENTKSAKIFYPLISLACYFTYSLFYKYKREFYKIKFLICFISIWKQKVLFNEKTWVAK